MSAIPQEAFALGLDHTDTGPRVDCHDLFTCNLNAMTRNLGDRTPNQGPLCFCNI